MKLKNKVVVIIGGSRGIGKAIAHICAKEGAKVVLAARSAVEMEMACREIKAETGAVIEGHVCDVASTQDVHALFKKAEKLGPVYGLVCAAGIYGPIGP